MRVAPICVGESPGGTVTHSFPNSFSKWARTTRLMKKHCFLVLVDQQFVSGGEKGTCDSRLLPLLYLELKTQADSWVGTHDLLEGVWVYLWLLCAVKKEDVPERDVDFYFSFVCVCDFETLCQQGMRACTYTCMYTHTWASIELIKTQRLPSGYKVRQWQSKKWKPKLSNKQL